MSEILKAFAMSEPRKPKVHTVSIQGQTVVVSLEKKLEVQKHGEDAYMWKSASEFVLKPKPKLKTQYPVLKNAETGYTFEDNDIHWPKSIEKGGFAWQIEKE